MPTERQLSDFAGTWLLEREIAHADGTRATFRGDAVFRQEGPGVLRYEEEGQLHLPTGQTMRATRAYRWEEGLMVFFEDGRPFHQIPTAGGSARHLCPPDTYDVNYDFSDWPRWQAIWDVTGPKKAYNMISRYRPEGSGPAF